MDLKQQPSTVAGIAGFAKNGQANAPDPFELVAGDITTLSSGIKTLLGSDHPVLEVCARYFFELDGGKKIRPTMVLLMAYAANANRVAGTSVGSSVAQVGACLEASPLTSLRRFWPLMLPMPSPSPPGPSPPPSPPPPPPPQTNPRRQQRRDDPVLTHTA